MAARYSVNLALAARIILGWVKSVTHKLRFYFYVLKEFSTLWPSLQWPVLGALGLLRSRKLNWWGSTSQVKITFNCFILFLRSLHRHPGHLHTGRLAGWRSWMAGGLLCYRFFSLICLEQADMIFVKTFTLAVFGPVIFYPKARNSFKSCDHNSLCTEAFKPI